MGTMEPAVCRDAPLAQRINVPWHLRGWMRRLVLTGLGCDLTQRVLKLFGRLTALDEVAIIDNQ